MTVIVSTDTGILNLPFAPHELISLSQILIGRLVRPFASHHSLALHLSTFPPLHLSISCGAFKLGAVSERTDMLEEREETKADVETIVRVHAREKEGERYLFCLAAHTSLVVSGNDSPWCGFRCRRVVQSLPLATS